MTPDPVEQQKAIELYAALMEEVKLRESSAWKVIGGETELASPFAREYCFLQVRMIIETMALGCLVVHGDIPGTDSNKYQGEYNADQILKKLEELHPGFYPAPMQMTTGIDADWKKYFHLEFPVNDFLPKETLLKYYARCGGALHRGNVKQLHKAATVDTSNLDEPKGMLVNIRKLLEQHSIALFTPDTRLACLLSDPLVQGKTTVAIGPTSPI